MLAAWYDEQGPSTVLQVGELPDPLPGPGEVRVRLTRSGINPGDTKKRRATFGLPMPYPRIVPHSDGAGVIDRVGSAEEERRIGERVWVYGAQSYRPFGTAAQYTVLPSQLAVPTPEGLSDDLAACLGIPGITAHRAVFADGPVAGRTVLVHGVRGAVSSLAAQLAGWNGATVIGTVRSAPDGGDLDERTVALDQDPVGRIRALAPDGVDRIIEVAFGANIDLDAAVGRNGTTIAAFASPTDRPDLPFWPLLFNNTVIRLLGSDDFPEAAKQQAATDLSTAAGTGALDVPIADVLALDRIAEAHDLVDSGRAHGRVLLAPPAP
ncbi:NADPH:quinone reductase [Amnibacterium endophyticum]|uniref:NADPH:quinone reductase n=1 Tax=Amnibacterium endophyticum TaxID=2109337 RepID=A0ABW4LHT1_9MICO